MESLFYLRWDKGREAMAAQQRKDKFNLIPFFENGRNQLNYLSLCGRAALSGIWEMIDGMAFFDLWVMGGARPALLRKEKKTSQSHQLLINEGRRISLRMKQFFGMKWIIQWNCEMELNYEWQWKRYCGMGHQGASPRGKPTQRKQKKQTNCFFSCCLRRRELLFFL